MSSGQSRALITEIEMGMCWAIMFLGYFLHLIEYVVKKDELESIITPLSIFKKKRSALRRLIIGFRDYLSSQRILIAYGYCLILYILEMTSNQNQYNNNYQYWKEVLLFSIIAITLIGIAIELGHESKEYVSNAARQIRSAIRFDNLLNLTKTLTENISGKIGKLIKDVAIVLFETLKISIQSVFILALLSIAPIIVCYKNAIDLTFYNLFTAGIHLYELLIILLLLIVIIVCTIVCFLDFAWINIQSVNKISREELEKNILKMHFYFTKRRYVQTLINNGVKLEGDWPGKQRTLFGDDVLDRILAQWDCKEYSIGNYFSDGL